MSADEGARWAASSALLLHEGGLHARPAILLTQVANRYAARVWIGLSATGPWSDAKSIARVMALKAPSRTTVHFSAEGVDADEAVQTLATLVQRDFAKD
jgi:phosphocarrier protein HPr